MVPTIPITTKNIRKIKKIYGKDEKRKRSERDIRELIRKFM